MCVCHGYAAATATTALLIKWTGGSLAHVRLSIICLQLLLRLGGSE